MKTKVELGDGVIVKAMFTPIKPNKGSDQYAIYWGYYFLFRGSDNIDEVAWYKQSRNNEIKRQG